MKMNNANESKVILVGDPSVGKTSLIQQYNRRIFESDSESTVGATFVNQVVKTEKGDITLHIWDTAGQERYRSLIPMYSRNAVAALLVLDITKIESYRSRELWINILKSNCLPHCRIYVAANKIDLEKVDLQVPLNDLKSWCESNGFDLFLTSAKDYQSIDAVFRKISIDIIDSKKVLTDKTQNALEVNPEPKNQCC